MQWLVAEKATSLPDDISESSESFEKIDSAERETSRMNWEKVVFEPLETDQVSRFYPQSADNVESSDPKSI